ncbi:MAG: lipoprotein [Gammaproteobacteria bacterium]|nr:lipoprotein [Gammaproteobacteria bacterium]
MLSRSIFVGSVVLILFVCLGSGGCGMKGPLELPPEEEEIFHATSFLD